jgi:hypothetical protein
VNYYQARQRATDGRWNFTNMNDGKVYIEPCCIAHEAEGHATAEEADRDFYEYNVANLRDYSLLNAQHPCAHPSHIAEQVWTAKGLGARMFGDALLCDEHRTPEGYREAIPFYSPIQITSSY